MRISVIRGVIKRRLLVNFRADPEVVQRYLPHPFRPKIHRGHAVLGICLIRLERMRPAGLPALLGVTSENAAHRIAVEWSDATGVRQEGVFIPRRDTGSLLNRVSGGRLFPGEHHRARFTISDRGGHIDLSMESIDHAVSIRLIGEDANALPSSSCFESLAEASEFFESGTLGYSVTRDYSRLDGVRLRTLAWHVRALSVSEVSSSFFADDAHFPHGSVEFDHALVMRNIPHEWHKSEDLYSERKRAESTGA